MKRKIRLLSLVFAFVLILSACGSGSGEVVNIYNWGEYIDKDLLDKFEDETGISVKYDNFTTNEDMYVMLKNSNVAYDVIVPSDYMIERMVNEGMLQKIDFNNIPNYKNIDDTFKQQAYDPNDEYSVPYFWGTLGIVYNTDLVDEEITSWDALWDEKYSGQIIMMDSSRDALGISLVRLGYSLNSRDKDELVQARDELIKQKSLVRAYQMDETKDLMVNGEAALAVMYSGDAALAMSEADNLKYVIPKEGSNIFLDAMVIPANAQNKENAEAWINFMSDVDHSAQNAMIGYSTPISASKEKLPSEFKDNLAAYPAQDDIKDLEVFQDPSDMVDVYDSYWQEVKSH